MKEIIRFIQEHSRFAVTSHARPDGDSIGSSLGLALALQQMGKTADVFGADPRPRPYKWLPGVDEIQVTDRVEGEYDGLFVLECNDLARPGLDGLDKYFVLNIDHHPNTEAFGNLNWVNEEAAAVGEMIYQLVKELEIPITRDIAVNLYVAILTDTGSFQYSNTRDHTFLVVSDLVRCGVDPAEAAREIYMTQPHARIELLGLLLQSLELHPSKKIAAITLTRKMLDDTGAAADDTEGVVNYPLSVEGVVLAAFFREETPDSFRVSLRSKHQLDVRSVAKRFGGGGHRNAAGLTVKGSFDEAREKVMAELEKLLPGES